MTPSRRWPRRSCATRARGRGGAAVAGASGAREKAVELREAFTTLRNDRIDGMIAELAARLVDDTPCPVCGAIDHPDPSEVRGRQVSRADEEAAALAADEAQERVRMLGERLASVAGRARRRARTAPRAAARRGRGRSAAGRAPRVRGRGRAAQPGGRKLAVAEAELAHAERQLAEWRDEHGPRTEAARAAAIQQAAGAAQRGEQLQRRLRELLGGEPDVRTARRSTAALIESVEGALTADGRPHGGREGVRGCAGAGGPGRCRRRLRRRGCRAGGRA